MDSAVSEKVRKDFGNFAGEIKGSVKFGEKRKKPGIHEKKLIMLSWFAGRILPQGNTKCKLDSPYSTHRRLSTRPLINFFRKNRGELAI